MRKGLRYSLLAAAFACVFALNAFAGGITEPGGGSGGGGAGDGNPPIPVQPGTIDSASVAYYGPVRCFGARAVVFYITTTDNDSLASASIEFSDDNIKWYATSAAVGGNGTTTTVQLANKSINGRVGRVTYTPTVDGSAAKAGMTFLTDRWVKLKLTANGAAVSGVAVHPIVVYETWRAEEIDSAVYTWGLN